MPPTTARKTTRRRPAARKTTTARKAVPPAKPLPIQTGHSYIDFGCRRVWLEKDAYFNTVTGKYESFIHAGDDDNHFDSDASENFERFMLAMYELANRAGIPIPPIPAAKATT